MPIDYRNYPDNWKTEIRPSILKRAENKCEKCGVENYAVGWRENGWFIHAMTFKSGNRRKRWLFSTYKQARIAADSCNKELKLVGINKKCIVIVLTIAHLNHDIADNREDNLKALCQRCHNVMDAPYRAKNRKQKTIK